MDAVARTTSQEDSSATSQQNTCTRIPAVLGTMSIPSQLDVPAARESMEYFLGAGFDMIDTAILYQGGKTEIALGEIGVGKYRVAAKANPWFKDVKTHDFFQPTHGLKADLIKDQLRHSLKTLGLTSVDLFYLHAPDHNTPIEESLKAVHELKSEGLFNDWGVSNYTAWETVDIWHICKANGWQPPSVYQGMYNAITREVERELLPALKRLGMRFYAYNPLAGGVLTGKHSFDKPPTDGRFDGATIWGTIYMQRYWHKTIFDCIDNLKALCDKHETTMVSASIRWMTHHSALSAKIGDAVIICGSSVSQVKQNVDACADEAPLPQEIVQEFEKAWQACKPLCASYFK